MPKTVSKEKNLSGKRIFANNKKVACRLWRGVVKIKSANQLFCSSTTSVL